jgi:cytochrome c
LAPLAVGAVVLMFACATEQRTAPSTLENGDPERGQHAIESYGCGSCHVIPGIEGADGTVGPPLNAYSQRSYIGGQAENTPTNLIQWIENPQSIEPKTAMPNLGVTSTQARDIAAYLYTLH